MTKVMAVVLAIGIAVLPQLSFAQREDGQRDEFQPSQQMGVVRIDRRRIRGNPELQRQYHRDLATCRISVGGSGGYFCWGLGGCLAGAIGQGIAQVQADDRMTACMRSFGYIRIPVTEVESYFAKGRRR